MNRRLPFVSRFASLGLAVAALSILAVGCATGPSQTEMDALKAKEEAVKAAEAKVADLQAEKARLERSVAEKQASKKAIEEKRDFVKEHLKTMAN